MRVEDDQPDEFAAAVAQMKIESIEKRRVCANIRMMDGNLHFRFAR